MIYRYPICLFLSLFLAKMAHAQTEEVTAPKWIAGFSVGGTYSSMSYVSLSPSNNNFSGSVLANPNRSWKFDYQPGFALGVMVKQNSEGRFAFQGEFNLLLSRQKATLTDIPTITTASPNQFQTILGMEGTAEFNTLYFQIPVLLSMNVDASTSIEGGIFINSGLTNNNSQDMTTTTFVEFDNKTFRSNTLSPPRVYRNTVQPAINTNWGWLLGVHYDMTKSIALRLRYENGLSGISDFKDLREQRLFVGVVFKKRKK
jgi:opacity protein-like surface antigen